MKESEDEIMPYIKYHKPNELDQFQYFEPISVRQTIESYFRGMLVGIPVGIILALIWGLVIKWI